MPMSPANDRLRALAVLACASGALGAGGCSHSATREFDDRPRQDVWQAMVQAAREPRYPDWFVIENQVTVDDADHTVHIYRSLKRDLVTPGTKPRREEATWRFAATLLPSSPTTVEYSSPDWAVPAHFWAQADHYFAQVRLRLAEMGPITPAPGDPMDGRTPAGTRDPEPPGHVAPPPVEGGLAAP